MNGQPKISVIIPVYNVEDHLRECLDSIVNQTLKDIQIICVDDGSTDSSLEILREYERLDDRFIVLQQRNQGAGRARNLAIVAAEGKYIAFMDSDDYYPDETVLETLYTAAKDNGAKICGGSVVFLRGKEFIPAELMGVKYFFKEDGWVNYHDFQQDFYYQRFIFCREMLMENNILFPYYRRYQDPPFFVRAMLKAEKFYAVAKPVYTYREGSSNAALNEQKVYDRLEGLRDELNLTRKAGLKALHGRIVPRVYNFLNTICGETDLADRPRTKEAIWRCFREIDEDAALDAGKVNELEGLKEYLSDLLSLGQIREGLLFVKKAPAFADGTRVPKVSVIIPIYNVEKYMRQCMDSVVNQTLRDIEIICVDDQSPDDSISIVEEYAAEDDRITIVEQKNKGLSGARNSGFIFAQGKYVYYLDSDDYLALDAMEILYNTCEEKDLEAVYFDYYRIYDDGSSKPPIDRKGYDAVYDGVSFMRTMRDSKDYIQTAWSQLVRRDFLLEHNIEYYEGILHEDNLFTFYVLMNANRVSHVNKQLYYHRLRANSIMTVAQTHKNAIGYFISMQEMMCYALKERWEPEKAAEIWRCFNGMRMDTGYVVQKLSDAEVSKIVFDNPVSQLLFDTFFLEGAVTVVQQPAAVPASVPQQQTDSRELKVLRSKNRMLEQNIRDIKSSVSFRVGRFITWGPRMVRGFFRSRKENGSRHTWERVLVHLHLKKDPLKVAPQKLPVAPAPKTPAQPAEKTPTKAEVKNPVPQQQRENLTKKSMPKKPAPQQPVKRDAYFYSQLTPDQYEGELKLWYKNLMKKDLDLDNPQTFAEKMQWMKLYDSTPLKTKLVDKYLVREWITEQIGSEYLIPLLGVWDSFDEIDFDKLPKSFVLKANHGSGWNILVKDKSKLDMEDARRKFDQWMNSNFAYSAGLELQYLNVPPKIIAEQYVEKLDTISDYKFMCFRGEVKFLWVDTERYINHRQTLFTPQWERIPDKAVTKTPPSEKEIEKPKCFDQMLEIASKLSKDFAHVRVDLYEDDGKIYFGEMTFTPWTGLPSVSPREFNAEMGSWIQLPPKSPIPRKKKL